MTDQQIDEAIAKHCGWVECSPGRFSRQGMVITLPTEMLPDYCGDLNAMHEAEKALSRGLGHCQKGGFGLYEKILAEICNKTEPLHPISATARQRAEAFVRYLAEAKERMP